jgi:hypothetical protein
MRGEEENRQLLINTRGWGSGQNLTNTIQLKITPFADSEGNDGPVITNWWQVGYVYCHHSSLYEGSGGGWRPDPLLQCNPNGLLLESEVTQPIWLSFTISPHTTSTTYYSTLSFIIGCSNGTKSITDIPISLTVWDISLPPLSQARFRSIFSYPGNVVKSFYGNRGDEVNQLFLKMLVDQRIAGNSLYSEADYNWNVTITFDNAGVQLLTLYDINSILNPSHHHHDNHRLDDPPSLDGLQGDCPNFTIATAQKAIKILKPVVDKAIASGIMDKMFVYGFDETPQYCEDSIRLIYSHIKRMWPQLKTVATLNWLPSIDLPLDIWVIHYNLFNETLSLPWIHAGRKQFWYHSIVPVQEDYLNSYIESPSLEIRLMFWLASCYRVDGWLYYRVTRWLKHEFMTPLNGTARTSFDPISIYFTPDTKFANGDGNFIYPGLDGPIPSMRLHNFRDAFEDAELFHMLPLETVKELVHPLVQSPNDFTLDPLLLEKQRIQAASLISNNYQQ